MPSPRKGSPSTAYLARSAMRVLRVLRGISLGIHEFRVWAGRIPDLPGPVAAMARPLDSFPPCAFDSAGELGILCAPDGLRLHGPGDRGDGLVVLEPTRS